MRTSRLFAALAAVVVLLALTSLPARAATIGLAANISHQPTPGGGNATRIDGNGLIIDHSLNPFIQLRIAVTASQGDHQGVSQVVYDVVSPEAKSKGYFLDDIGVDGVAGANRTYSGFNNFGGPPSPQNISAAMYDSPTSCLPPDNYSGGWGWTNSGLPWWGNTGTNPGSILGAGDSLPLTWSGDNAPLSPGIQSFARIGVGQGVYTAPAEDGAIAGTTLGFGYDVVNQIGGGDGSYWFHTILIDTTGWDKQTYTFNLQATAGNVLRSDADLSQPLGGGFRQAVTGSDLQGTSISFTIIPEPAGVALILIGGLAIVRRRY